MFTNIGLIFAYMVLYLTLVVASPSVCQPFQNSAIDHLWGEKHIISWRPGRAEERPGAISDHWPHLLGNARCFLIGSLPTALEGTASVLTDSAGCVDVWSFYPL